MEELHKMMDEAFENRKHRIRDAVKMKSTSMQWDLIVAGVEEAVIQFLKLEAKEATKLERRSTITFNKKRKGC